MRKMSSSCVVVFIISVAFMAYCGSNDAKKGNKEGENVSATVSIDSVGARAGDSLDVPIFLECDEAIAGLQMKIQFDPKMVTIGGPKAAKRSSDMLVMHNVKDSELLIMMYSISGKSIPPGKGVILMLPLNVFESATGSSSLDLKEVILAKQDAQTIPASRKSGKVLIKKR